MLGTRMSLNASQRARPQGVREPYVPSLTGSGGRTQLAGSPKRPMAGTAPALNGLPAGRPVPPNQTALGDSAQVQAVGAPGPAQGVDPVMRQQVAHVQRRVDAEDLTHAMGAIRAGTNADHETLASYLDMMADRNPAIQQAFQNRARDPRTWGMWQQRLSQMVRQSFGAATAEPAKAPFQRNYDGR